MKVLTGFKLGAVIVLSAALAACGGAPSEKEVRAALEKRIKSDLGQISAMAGGHGADLKELMDGMMPTIENLNVKGCDSVGDDVYQCSVEATVSMMGEKHSNTEDIRLKKDKQGEWHVVR